MAQHNTAAAIPTAGADYDAVVAQLATLRDDVSKLAGTVADAAGHRGQSLTAEVSDGVSDATRYLGRQARGAEAQLTGAVTTHPYAVLILAAGSRAVAGQADAVVRSLRAWSCL